jgi:hypothetical protein
VQSRGKWVKQGVILVSILFFIWYSVSSPQYIRGERLEYKEIFCDYIYGSWVITLKLNNYGYRSSTLWMDQLTVSDQDVKNQVYDIFYIDDKGVIFRKDDFSRESAILLRGGEYALIQFKIPDNFVSVKSFWVWLRSRQGIDWVKWIKISSDTSIDRLNYSDDLSEAYSLYIQSYVEHQKFEYFISWIPQYIILCMWFGIILDGITQSMIKREALLN